MKKKQGLLLTTTTVRNKNSADEERETVAEVVEGEEFKAEFGKHVARVTSGMIVTQSISYNTISLNATIELPVKIKNPDDIKTAKRKLKKLDRVIASHLTPRVKDANKLLRQMADVRRKMGYD